MALAIVARPLFRSAFPVGLILALTSACASSGRSTTVTGPRPVPTPPPAVIAPAPAPAPNVAAPAPHPFVYAPGTYRYEIRSDAVISLAGDPRVDTVSTRAIVTLRITRSDSTSLMTMGSVDSFTVTSSHLGASSLPVSGVPFGIVSSPDGRMRDSTMLTVGTTDSIGICATPVSAVVAAGKELFTALPVPLAPAVEWTDSATTVTCRAALPVIARSVRHSRAAWAVVPTEWSRRVGDVAFEVARTTATTISGQGRAAGRQVDLGGSGEGSSLLYIDPELGVLLGGIGNGSTKIVLDAGSQRQEFVQAVHQQFRLLR